MIADILLFGMGVIIHMIYILIVFFNILLIDEYEDCKSSVVPKGIRLCQILIPLLLTQHIVKQIVILS